MRRTVFAAAAMVAMAVTAMPAGATPENNDNWHVHDLVNGVKQSDVQLKSFGVAFFPTLYTQEGDTYDPVDDPARCPDATDKHGMRPNGEHRNRPHNSGICHTDEYVIHLRSAAGGSDQVPAGWGSLEFNGQIYHYRLSPRGR